MTLPASGVLTLTDIQVEFGGSNPVAISEYYAGGSFVLSGTSGVNGSIPSSGVISFSSFYGAASVPPYWTPLLTSMTVWEISGCMHNGTFVLLLDGITYLSSDGITFTYGGSTLPIMGSADSAIASNGSVMICVGGSKTGNYGKTASSTDGITWVSRTASANAALGIALNQGRGRIACNGTKFVACWANTVSGSGPFVATTSDGITWTAVAGTNSVYLCFAAGINLYIARLGSPYTAFKHSTNNGVTWTDKTLVGTTALNMGGGVAYNGSKFLIFDGKSSSDFTTWTATPSFTAAVNDVSATYGLSPQGAMSWDGEQFVSLGSAEITSPDGITWTYVPQFSTSHPYAVDGVVKAVLLYKGAKKVLACTTDYGDTFLLSH